MDTDSKQSDLEEESSFLPLVGGSMLETRTSHLDDQLSEKLEHAFESQVPQTFYHNVAKLASEYDPIDLAYAASRLPRSSRFVIYENLPDLQAKIIFMINTTRGTRSAIFRSTPDGEIAQLLEQMPADEAIWVLEDLSSRRVKYVLEKIDPKKAQRLKELLSHAPRSAGRLMTNEFFSFHLQTTIGEVALCIRQNPGIDLTRRIFVLDDEGELIGYVPARNLIVNPDQLPLRRVMRPIVHTVTPDTSRDEVVDLVERYKDPALPVIDGQTNKMLGVITFEDVVEAMEEIADETIASLAGTGEDLSEHEPMIKRLLWRAPWLLVTVCAGLITATTMEHLSGASWFALLPFFVPLITGMSGNVGIQCSTVLVRGISTGELSSSSIGDAILQELGIGAMVGLLFGMGCGTVVYFLSSLGEHHAEVNPMGLSIIVSFGVFAACMNSALLGSYLPFLFTRLRIDPAIAAGPMVTAFNDVLSTLIFFLMSFLLYGLLIAP